MYRQSPWLFETPPKTPPLKDRVVSASITRILVVPFRRNFTDFRQAVRKAVGQYVTFRRDQGAYLDNLLRSEPTFPQTIQMQHSSMLQASPAVAEFTAIEVPATFIYTPGFKQVIRVTFP